MVNETAYRNSVMEAYFEGYGGNELFPLLHNVNVRKLKDACIFKLRQESYSGDDIHNLNHFLDQNNPYKKRKLTSTQKLIETIEDYAGFKKVEVFIKRYASNPESKTDPRNVELLAWLINFKPRPFEKFRKSDEDHDFLLSFKESMNSLTSDKEKLIAKQMAFFTEMFEKLKEEILIEVLKDYDLNHNITFQRYANRIEDQVTLQAYTISKLEAKISVLQSQLKRAKWARRIAGGFGLFFVSIDYREPSLDSLFGDLLHSFSGMEEEDIIDDLV